LNKRDSLATTKTLVLPAGQAVPFSSFQFPTRHGEHFAQHWVVRWDLGDGETHLQETLPHPIVHIFAENGTGVKAREPAGVTTCRAWSLADLLV
jgi:hypothetical protein